MAKPAKRIRQMRVSGCEVWIDGNRLAVPVDRRVEVSLEQTDRAQIIMSGREVRIGMQRTKQELFRGVGTPRAVCQNAQSMQRAGMMRIAVENLTIDSRRLTQSARGKMPSCETEDLLESGRHRGESPGVDHTARIIVRG
jgi:hypothetical protein